MATLPTGRNPCSTLLVREEEEDVVEGERALAAGAHDLGRVDEEAAQLLGLGEVGGEAGLDVADLKW